jgi:hypothetical protein
VKEEDALIAELREIRRALQSIAASLVRVLNPKETLEQTLVFERKEVIQGVTGDSHTTRASRTFKRYVEWLSKPNVTGFTLPEDFNPDAQFYSQHEYEMLRVFYPTYKKS